ncbi:MAG: hypothetical protein K6D97_04195 [Clostridia bacterium]|nr:hypothetical protein [Clostridia bacterium]
MECKYCGYMFKEKNWCVCPRCGKEIKKHQHTLEWYGFEDVAIATIWAIIITLVVFFVGNIAIEKGWLIPILEFGYKTGIRLF